MVSFSQKAIKIMEFRMSILGLYQFLNDGRKVVLLIYIFLKLFSQSLCWSDLMLSVYWNTGNVIYYNWLYKVIIGHIVFPISIW